MQAPDMDVIKEIPGYKIIMKAVLKSQIQQLVEQLAETTGEESILLTASVTDGTLSHLGSENGKVFLDGHDEIKSQFLGFILKKHHRRKQVEKQFALGPGRKETFDTEQETVYLEASVHTELNPQVILEPILPPPPATKVHPVSIVRASSQIGPKGAASHAGPSKRGAAKKVQGAKEAQSADSDLGHLVKLEINNESEQSDSVPKAKSTPSATSKQSTQSSKDMPVLLDSAVSEQLNTTSGDLSYAEVSNIDSDFTSGAEASGLYSDIASGSKDMQLMENITIKLEADEMDYVPVGAEQSKADKDDPDWEPTAKKRRSSGSRSVASPGNKSVNVSGQGQTHTVKEELSEDEVEVEDVPTTSMPSNPEPDPELEYRPKTRKLVEKAEFIVLEDDESLPEGFIFMAPGAQIAVKATWLHDIVASVKKTGKSGPRKTYDFNKAVVKRLIDGFYSPFQLAVEGGSSQFESSPVYNGIRLYALNHLSVTMTVFTALWNQKMAWARKIVKNLIREKNLQVVQTRVHFQPFGTEEN